MKQLLFLLLGASIWPLGLCKADEPPPVVWASQVRAAMRAGRLDEALGILDRVLAADADQTDALRLRAALYSQRREHTAAGQDLSAAIALEPRDAANYYLRGRAHFCAGKIDAAVKDFDRFVELEPTAAPRQWERGIALYYAGKYAEGAKQFALYQSFHNNDVENATWRFLCMAQDVGVERAQAELLPIEDDRRVPMMQIYALYRGTRQPDEVLAAAKAGDVDEATRNRYLFYAHLYVGLYYEALGKADAAAKHLFAAEKHKIGHYMWDVAHVHAQRIRERK